MGRFRGWVSVRRQNIQFVQYKNHPSMESPQKDNGPDVIVCV